MVTLKQQWAHALAEMTIRHIDPTCEPVMELFGDEAHPCLQVACDNTRDTLDQDKRIGRLNISSVQLTYWPGLELARAWLAAGWANYVTHEALELVLVNGVRPLDPHREPFGFDKNLRIGLPTVLTPESLRATLSLVMTDEALTTLLAQGAP